MPLKSRKLVLLSKVEAIYATDSVPVAASNAMLVSNLKFSPLVMSTQERNLMHPYYGNDGKVVAAVYGMLEFDAEVAGSGAAGTAPFWGTLMKGCAMGETAFAAPHAGTAQAGAASTITLAVTASAVDNYYNSLTIRVTGGTGNGQSRVVKSYVGATKVATVTEPWITVPDATSTYSIDAQVVYTPISSAEQSLTHYYQVDGIKYVLLGARGTFSMKFTAAGVPMMSFKFTGLRVAPADLVLPTPILPTIKPVAVNLANTTPVTLHAYAGVFQELTFDVANDVKYINRINSESVQMSGRKPVGTAVLEKTLVAAKDWTAPAAAGTTGALSLTHGTVAGNKVKVDAPVVQLTSVGDSQIDGIEMVQLGLDLSPSAGNDELTITAL